MGEFGKSGELGETGHAGKGICGSRHDREGEMGHAGGGFVGVGMTGEPLAPAKKKKQVCDVCGAPSKQTSENKSTRQKEKASLRRVRSAHLARAESKSTRQKEKASLRRVRSAHQANVREQKHLPKKIFPIRGDFDIIYE